MSLLNVCGGESCALFSGLDIALWPRPRAQPSTDMNGRFTGGSVVCLLLCATLVGMTKSNHNVLNLFFC